MSKKDGDKQASNVPGWSWVVAAIGLALVLGAAGFFVYQAFAGDDTPAEIVIETGTVVENAGGYLVPIQVVNHGEEVASGLLVEGALMDGETTIETSSVTFDYVPVGSRRDGGLIFGEDPREYDLKVQARGYALP
jgi:uncharacterized protein (TIGR02588 family)